MLQENLSRAKGGNMSEPVLKFRNVSVSCDREVLHDISLSLQEGEILSIVGESGSGKSTLLQSILRLPSSQAHITAGRILYHDRDLSSFSREDMRQLRGESISMLFQNAGAYLHPLRTIGSQTIEMTCQHQYGDKSIIQEKALQILHDLEIQDPQRIWNSRPYECSGGILQRVGLMMALLLPGDLILADEPTSALDTISQRAAAEQLQKECHRHHTSAIITTHNISLAALISDQIVILHEGRIIEQGKTDDLMHHPQHPYTKKLLSSVRHLERNL